MLQLLLTVGALNLLAAMSPGPDFAVVTKNALLGSRRAGIITALGISSALLIHITYCSLGLALVIAHSAWLFLIIKLLGGCYLIYLGVQAMIQPIELPAVSSPDQSVVHQSIADAQAFRMGFLTNLLNPKAALFLLAMFTFVVRDHVLEWIDFIIAVELFLVVFAWFSIVSWMMTHPAVYRRFVPHQRLIVRLLGVFLIVFGASLFFIKPLS